jgi:hypothetical protein
MRGIDCTDFAVAPVSHTLWLSQCCTSKRTGRCCRRDFVRRSTQSEMPLLQLWRMPRERESSLLRRWKAVVAVECVCVSFDESDVRCFVVPSVCALSDCGAASSRVAVSPSSSGRAGLVSEGEVEVEGRGLLRDRYEERPRAVNQKT